MLFVYLYSDIFHCDIYVINTFVCTYWLKSTRHCRVDMQFELPFSIYFYVWHICITCCVMGRIWIMRQICVTLVRHEIMLCDVFCLFLWACLGRRKKIHHVYRLQEFTSFNKINNQCVPHKLIKMVDNRFINILQELLDTSSSSETNYNSNKECREHTAPICSLTTQISLALNKNK